MVKRGLKDAKPVVSDAHEGRNAANARVLGATWQRCRIHWIARGGRSIRGRR